MSESVPVSLNFSRCSEQFLQLFPAEIWLLIFDKVTDPDDLISCSNASPLFYDLLYRTRTSFLFPKVWNVLEKVVYSTANKYDELNSISRNDPFYYIDNGVRKILKLRLVCKSWKNGIDKFYQNHLLYGKSCDVAYGESFENYFRPRHWLSDNEQITAEFLEKFSNSQCGSNNNQNKEFNPFISKIICLQYNLQFWGEQIRPFYDEWERILQMYGSALNKFCIRFQSDIPMPESYSNFQHYLSLMQNLKVLEIDGNRYNALSVMVEEYNTIDMTGNPFSKMPKLEFLSVRNMPDRFFDNVIRLNNHISRLKIGESSEHLSYDVTSVPFLNLRRLEFWIKSESELKALMTAEFSVEFAHLELILNEFITPQNVFSLLNNKWGNTLKTLRLELLFKNLKSYREKDKARLEWVECFTLQRSVLPRVTTMTVEMKFLYERPNIFQLLENRLHI